MSYGIVLTEEAEKQLIQWKKSGQKKDLAKILSLFKELEEPSIHRNRTSGTTERQPFRVLE